MKNRKILISLTASAACLALSVGSVFAYFNASKETSKSYSIDLTDNLVEVSNFKELYLATNDASYNSESMVSENTQDNRKTICLTGNITLENDLYITADVNIDLSGYSITMNNHTLTFMHSYEGLVEIYNGSIIADAADSIILDMPNATISMTDLTLNDGKGNELESDGYIKTLNLNETYTAYNAFYMVSQKLVNDVDYAIDRLDYTDALALYATNSSFKASDFISVKSHCAYCEEEKACSYLYKDADLPLHYYSNDIEITYSSTDENVLSDFGDFHAPASSEDITLTASVTINDNTYSCDFTLHAINITTEKNTVAENMLLNYIDRFYDSDNSQYEFNNAVQLPLKSDVGVTYSYKAYDASNNSLDVFTAASDYVTDFNSTGTCVTFEYTCNGDTSTTKKCKMTSSNSANVTTSTSIARSLINTYYGGENIVLTKTRTSFALRGTGDNAIPDSALSENKITSLTFELVNDANNIYSLKDNTLVINEGMNPADYVQSVVLNCKFVFNGSEEVDIIVPIIYNDDSSGEIANQFLLPYYTYYNELLASTTGGGKTITSFKMPFAYSADGPYICFDIATTDIVYDEASDAYTFPEGYNVPDILSVSLYYNGADSGLTFEYSDTITSFTDVLDNAGVSLADIASYDDASWVFTIDTSKISLNNQKIVCYYNYKFETSSPWDIYKKTSTFEIEGGFISGTSQNEYGNVITDSALFTWIYDNFKTAEGDGSFILQDWLSQSIDLDIDNDATLANVTDFYGIQYLKGTKVVDLHGYSMSSDVQTNLISYLSQMTWLEELDLSDCGLTDYTSTGMIATTTNPLSSLGNLTNLKTLDISNNSLYYFDYFDNLVSLETVYCYKNQNDSSIADYYGSLGMANYTYYDDLVDNGVSVYIDYNSNSQPVLYENSVEVNDYVRLKNIEYQSTLANGVSIEKLYTSFSSSTSDYSLENSGTLAWGYDGDKTTCDYFKVTFTISGNGISIVVKYYVDRFDA